MLLVPPRFGIEEELQRVWNVETVPSMNVKRRGMLAIEVKAEPQSFRLDGDVVLAHLVMVDQEASQGNTECAFLLYEYTLPGSSDGAERRLVRVWANFSSGLPLVKRSLPFAGVHLDPGLAKPDAGGQRG